MACILLVDDEVTLRSVMAAALEVEGHDVRQAGDSVAAIADLEGHDPIDLLVLDIELAKESGLGLLQSVRRESDVPVVVVSARGDEVDRVVGLRLGADDYVAKPFSMRELVARIGAVLRRSRPADDGGRVELGSVDLDLRRHVLRVRGIQVHTTRVEFSVLATLAASAGDVVPRARLLREIWPHPDGQTGASLTEHVRRLRHKIELDPAHPLIIETVRGAGYRLVPDVAR